MRIFSARGEKYIRIDSLKKRVGSLLLFRRTKYNNVQQRTTKNERRLGDDWATTGRQFINYLATIELRLIYD